MSVTVEPLERDKRQQARADWETRITHLEPQFAWKGTVKERGLSFKLDDKFATMWEPACIDFDGLQLQLAAKGAQFVNMAYRVRFDLGYDCPDLNKIVYTMSSRMLGWPTRFKPGDAVDVYNWRKEPYVQWGIKTATL